MKKNKKKTGFIASLKLQAVLTSPAKITRPIVGPGFAYIIFIVHDIKVLVCNQSFASIQHAIEQDGFGFLGFFSMVKFRKQLLLYSTNSIFKIM